VVVVDVYVNNFKTFMNSIEVSPYLAIRDWDCLNFILTVCRNIFFGIIEY